MKIIVDVPTKNRADAVRLVKSALITYGLSLDDKQFRGKTPDETSRKYFEIMKLKKLAMESTVE